MSSEVLSILFSVILIVLTVVLTIVGVQLILVLSSFRQAIKRVNNTFDEVEAKFKHLAEPLQNLAGIAAGVKTGVKVFEGLVGFLSKRKTEETDKDE